MIRRPFPAYMIAVSTSFAVILGFWSFGNDSDVSVQSAKSTNRQNELNVKRSSNSEGILNGKRMLVDLIAIAGDGNDAKIELVYQTPDGYSPGLRTKALLFMAHGCSHAATDMFDRSESCQECIGLPIEKRIVRTALEKGFSVVAVTSVDRYKHILAFILLTSCA
jgi:hypothetical protein